MKIRLDVLIFERGLAESREKAQALIIAGKVLSGDTLLDKPGTKVDPDIEIRIKGKIDHYVSRGAHKLLGALSEFKLTIEGKICLDIGASTGGFTQVCLENGATKVFAVDVGSNQLHWKIRSDPRVVSMEGVNFREASENLIPTKVDFVCIDTSFISLKKILPSTKLFLKEGSEVVALIKPQHEVEKEEVGKGGIVKKPELHDRVVKEISDFSFNDLS